MKKLFRSNKDKKIAGVCGGLGEFFNIDPTIIRVILAVLVIFWGFGFVIYGLMWLIVPTKE